MGHPAVQLLGKDAYGSEDVLYAHAPAVHQERGELEPVGSHLAGDQDAAKPGMISAFLDPAPVEGQLGVDAGQAEGLLLACLLGLAFAVLFFQLLDSRASCERLGPTLERCSERDKAVTPFAYGKAVRACDCVRA